jgi:hypothetical protein
MFRMMTKAILAGLMATTLLAGPVAQAAEPQPVLTVRTPKGGLDGRLIRTGQGLALLGADRLTPLQGGGQPILWAGRKLVTPVAPSRRWLLAVEKPETGGFMEPQLRGRMVVGDLNALAGFPDRVVKILHNAAWPVAAAENPDGSLTILLWAKAAPFVTEPGYRLVRWTPGPTVAKTGEWPGTEKVVGLADMMSDGTGGWVLLQRLDDNAACGRRAGFSLIGIDPELKVSAGSSTCLPEAYTAFTTKIVAAAQTPDGPVWFVSGLQAGSHRLARITPSGGGLKVKQLGELKPGDITSAAYDGADLLVVQGERVTRIAADGSATGVDVPTPACDGRPGSGKRFVSVSSLEGRVYLTSAAGDCVGVWTL